MSKDVEAGDIVELKSGSPRMTVAQVLTNGMVVCNYYDLNNNEVTTVNTFLAALKLAAGS